MKKGKSSWIRLGVAGVDSGQLMVCDPCYLGDWVDNQSNDAVPDGDFSYAGACKKTIEAEGGQLNFKAGHAGAGVVFTSGFGDGCYEVLAKVTDYGDMGQRVEEVRIKLIGKSNIKLMEHLLGKTQH